MVWEREDGGTYFPQSCLANRFHAARPLLRVRQERLRDRSAGAEAGRQGTATAHVHEHTRSMQRCHASAVLPAPLAWGHEHARRWHGDTSTHGAGSGRNKGTQTLWPKKDPGPSG
jgi:hypothetical protein